MRNVSRETFLFFCVSHQLSTRFSNTKKSKILQFEKYRKMFHVKHSDKKTRFCTMISLKNIV